MVNTSGYGLGSKKVVNARGIFEQEKFGTECIAMMEFASPKRKKKLTET